jgi:hypothetical protein
MSAFDFCRHVIGDIRDHFANADEYHLIKMSGLIRQLLFDKNKLLMAAQKECGLKFRFYVSSRGYEQDPADASPWLVCAIVGSLDSWGDNEIEVSPDEYGLLRVLVAGGKGFTIKDIVKYVAHKRGGIHYDPKELEED